METYSAIPSQFVVGDTLVIDLPQGVYPSPDYSLQLVLVSSSASKLVVESTPSDGDHRLTVDTSSLSSGRYDYQLKAVGDDFRRTIQTGSITALADFASEDITQYDGRDVLDRTLDALLAVREGRASKTQMSYQFDGVNIEHKTPEQINADIIQVQREIAARNRLARLKKGRSPFLKIRTGF